MTIQELATEMGQPVAEVEKFIACLHVWTDKGYTVEQAIAKHEQTVLKMLESATRLAQSQGCDMDYAFRQFVGDAFWDEVNAYQHDERTTQ